MGGKLSAQQRNHAEELQQILRSQTGKSVTLDSLSQLLLEIQGRCSWYPEAGTLVLQDWINIGTALHEAPRAAIQHLLLWQRCKAAIEKLGVQPLISLLPDKLPPLTLGPFFLTTPAASVSLLPDKVPSLPPSPYVLTTPAASAMIVPSAPLQQADSFDLTPRETAAAMIVPSALPQQTDSFDPTPRQSAVKAGFAAAQLAGNLTTEELSEGLQAFPVTTVPSNQGGVNYNWQALPYTILRDLRKSVAENGLQSPFTYGILEGVSTAYNLIPQDWKDLFCMLLTPAQYVVWNSEYQREALTAGNNSGGLYIPDQLYGTGMFNTIQQQATGIPGLAYPIIAHCVLKAVRRVPVSTKSLQSFTAIHQNPAEPYSNFIDRLQTAIRRQVTNTNAHSKLMLTLAFENANADCKKLLQSLVGKPDTTLAIMLKTCSTVGTQAFQMEALATALQKGFHPEKKPQDNCSHCHKPG